MADKNIIQKELEELTRMRDELRLKLHLGKADARDALARLEQRWPEVERKMKELERESSTAAAEVGEAARDLIRELKRGYRAVLYDSHEKRF